MAELSDIQAEIDETVKGSDVVLFMKGTAQMPRCGFSQRVVQILGYLDVTYTDVDVLVSDDMRQGIKDYSDWPTTPQLYVKGEFVGGCDIITEMVLSGELDTAFEEAGIAFNKEAAEAIRAHNSQQA
ncbi:MAG: Grx4 family monothiol glutaredoxin [Pseudomonadota bacterium]